MLFYIGHRLSNSLTYEKVVLSVMDCAHLCLSEQPQCKSINYESKKKQYDGRRYKCQLNNKTKTMEPKDLVPDSAFSYFEPFKVRFKKSVIVVMSEENIWTIHCMIGVLKIKMKTKKLYLKIVKNFRESTNWNKIFYRVFNHKTDCSVVFLCFYLTNWKLRLIILYI